jgi:hypothetical protein
MLHIRAGTGIVLASLSIALMGCATHLYDGERHKAAQNAESSYKESEVTKALLPEYENQKRLSHIEIEALRAIRNAQRNVKLAELLDPVPSGSNRAQDLEGLVACGLDALANARLHAGPVVTCEGVQLQPDTAASIRAIRDYRVALDDVVGKRQTYEKARRAALVLKEGLPACDNIDVSLLEAASTEGETDARPASVAVQRACADLQQAVLTLRAAAAQLPKGALRSQVDTVEQQERDRAAKRAALAEARKRLKNAETSLAAARKAGEVKPVNASKAIDKALTDALDGLEKVRGIELAQKILADRRLQALTTLIEGAASARGIGYQTAAPGEQQRITEAADVLALIPSLVDDIDAFQRASTPPPLPHLILEQERQRVLRDDAERALKRSDRMFALERKKLRARLLQYEYLQQSWAAYRDFAGDRQIAQQNRTPITTTIAAALAPKPQPDPKQQAMYESLLAYGASISSATVLIDEAEAEQLALQYEAVVDKSIANVAAWDSLIRVPLSGLSAYFATGITPEQLGGLLQTGVLGVIAGRI